MKSAVVLIVLFAGAGLAQPQSAPKIAVASIKTCKPQDRGASDKGGDSSPGRLRLACIALGSSPEGFPGLLQTAYGLYADGRVNPVWSIPKIEGGPAWINSEEFEIEMTSDAAASEEMMLGPMMQALLEGRFKLKVHRETREGPVYALTVAKGGPKLKPFREGSCTPSGSAAGLAGQGQPPPCKGSASSDGTNKMILEGQGMTLDEFPGFVLPASAFGFKLDRPLINRTQVAGRFDFHLEMAIDDLAAAPSDSGPSIFSAIQQQLGLRIEAARGAIEVLVIDRIERPSDN